MFLKYPKLTWLGKGKFTKSTRWINTNAIKDSGDITHLAHISTP